VGNLASQEIRTKPCNTQKCPEVNIVLQSYLKNKRKNQKKSGAEKFQRPIVTVAAFSNKPQRYTKCIIKENDAFLTSYNKASKQLIKQPIRIVMNNMTVTLYADEDYENKIHTFNLDTSSILRSDFCCVQFLDSLRKYKVCGFQSDCGTRLNNLWANNWLKDFRMFKQDCRSSRSVSRVKPPKTGDEDDDIGELFDQAGKKGYSSDEEIRRQAVKFQQKVNKTIQNKINNKREKTILNSIRSSESLKARAKLSLTQNVGFDALKKENEIENLIEHEEKDREVRVVNALAKKIKKENRKQKCLSKTIKRRQIDTQIIEDKREAENEEGEAKEELKLEIDIKRNQLKRKIANMRKRVNRRKAAMETQLQRIRAKMAKDIMLANKDGDMELCRKGKRSDAKRNNYCDNNFIDDYLKNYDCKDKTNFCYMCCENEFGNNFVDKRNECYDMCDGKQVKKQAKKKSYSGSLPKMSSSSSSKKAAKKKELAKLGGWIWVKNPLKKKKKGILTNKQ